MGIDKSYLTAYEEWERAGRVKWIEEQTERIKQEEATIKRLEHIEGAARAAVQCYIEELEWQQFWKHTQCKGGNLLYCLEHLTLASLQRQGSMLYLAQALGEEVG